MNNTIKGISVGLGTVLVASNFYTITLLSKKSNLPMFDLPVSKYSTYEIEADKDSYKIRHRMHDPRIIASMESSKKPAGFLGASKSYVTKESQKIAGEKDVTIVNNDELTAKQIACIEERSKGAATGELNWYISGYWHRFIVNIIRYPCRGLVLIWFCYKSS